MVAVEGAAKTAAPSLLWLRLEPCGALWLLLVVWLGLACRHLRLVSLCLRLLVRGALNQCSPLLLHEADDAVVVAAAPVHHAELAAPAVVVGEEVVADE